MIFFENHIPTQKRRAPEGEALNLSGRNSVGGIDRCPRQLGDVDRNLSWLMSFLTQELVGIA